MCLLRIGGFTLMLMAAATQLAAQEPRAFGKPLPHWLKLLKSEEMAERQIALTALAEFCPPAKAAVPD